MAVREVAGHYRTLYGQGLDVVVVTCVAYMLGFSVRLLTFKQMLEGSTDHVEILGQHIHHMVPGLVVLLLGIILAIVEWRPHRMGIHFWRAAFFGVGAAVVLDEMSLLIYVNPDIYWTGEGLLASGVAYLVFLLALAGTLAFGLRFLRDVVGTTVQAAVAATRAALARNF